MKKMNSDLKTVQDETRYEAHQNEMTGDYTVRVGRKQDIIARILCALAAVMIWLYAMSVDNVDSEKTFTGVLVNIENEAQLASDYNMSVISGYDNTVSITVKGKKSDINKYTSADLTAYVNMLGVSSAGRHQIEVEAAAPAGLSVVEISPNALSIYTDQIATKMVPIEIIPYYTMDATLGLGLIETNIEVVSVSGPAGVLDTITSARAELDLGQLTASVTQRVPLALIGEMGESVANPYIRVDTTDVLVTVPVYQYKEVPVTYAFKYGYLNAENARVTVTPSKIMLRADPLLLADFDEYFALQIDETKLTGDHTQRVKLSLPDGMLDVDKIENITFEIAHIGTSTKALSMDSSAINVKMPNGEELEYEFLEPVFNFTVRAPDTLIQNISDRHMMASIDLSRYANVSGIVSVPVTIAPLSSALGGKAYAVGTYNIQVRLG